MAEFFAMGGYGGYIWPAYVISLAALAAAAIWTFAAERRVRKRLAQLEGPRA
jgi:heme exporter protein CcmD